jgi:RHS repeat-associated protein
MASIRGCLSWPRRCRRFSTGGSHIDAPQISTLTALHPSIGFSGWNVRTLWTSFRHPLLLVVLAVLFLLSMVSPCTAQAPYDPVLDQGIMPFQAYDGGNFDSVNLATGTLTLHIPLVSFPQRGGKLRADFKISYNSPSFGSVTCTYEDYGCRWNVSAYPTPVSIVADTFVSVGAKIAYSCGTNCNATYSTFSESDGSTHPGGWTNATTAQARSLDGSGFLGTVASTPFNTVVDRRGVTYYCPLNSNFTSNPCVATDPNGNQMTFNVCCSFMGFTDTMGRQVPAPASPWNVPGPNGTTATYLLPGDTPGQNAVTLPDGTSYTFQYTTINLPLVGQQTTPQTFTVLSKVTFPSGGSITYGYPPSAVASSCANQINYYLPITSRSVDANDGNGPQTWTYSRNSSTAVVTVTDPVGNKSTHTFAGPSGNSLCFPYEVQNQQFDGQGNLLKTVNTAFAGAGSGEIWLPPIDYLPTSVTTIWADGQERKTSTTYDRDHGTTFAYGVLLMPTGIQFGSPTGYTDNPWSVAETDYASNAPGGTLRTANTNYQAFANSNYLGRNLLDLISSIQVQNGGGVQQAYTNYGYDEFGLQSSGVAEQKVAGESYPGNQTSIHRWLSNGSAVSQAPCNVSVASGGYLLTNYVYFDTGEIQKATDPCLYPTSYLYSSAYYGAYRTTLTNAANQNTTFGYDFNTGFVTSITDPNSQATTKTYDIMGRLAGIAYSDGGSTTYCYTDLGGATCSQAFAPPFEVVETKAITSSVNQISTYVFDGLGRVTQTQLNSDSPTATYTQTTYDAVGRKSRVYNPTRCNPPTTNCGETTWGYATYNYDALNRVTSIIEQDGSAITTNYASFPCATITDETGKSRKSCADGLGRLSYVWEDPTGLNYETVYQYSALGDLLSVTQNGSNSSNARLRSFSYDSMSRLTSANNPESGTVAYGYDADGNVVTKNAPSPNQPSTGTRTVTTTYAYDMLNRLTGKSYNDGYASNGPTPGTGYAYDGNTLSGCATVPPTLADSYPVGRRTSMCDGSGATSWKHDTMGRVLQERRTIGTIKGDYENDNYNLDGSVTSVSTLGYATSYTYSAAARPVTAAHSTTKFVSSATYAPPGELAGMTIGSATGFAGISVTDVYNDRLQPILLSAASPSGTVFSECFDFHLGVAINTSPCPSLNAYTSGDSGNVYQIINTRDNNRTQNFIYDSLNRIQQAYSSGTGWGETFGSTATSPGVAPATSGIDAWGNLTNRSGVTTKTNYEPLSVSAGTNNRLTGFGYDPAGNMTSNGSTSYLYDDENRLIATAGYSYLYDGDGQRVEKCTEGTTPGICASSATGSLYWRGLGSDPLSETDLSGNIQNTYIFFNGQRIARSDSAGTIHYYFSDHLGSHGVVENATGASCEQDIDYYPYGGVENDYCPSVVQSYKFTGKLRDSESGLDNFGARYDASSIGRFMTPDWAVAPEDVPYANFGNPQSLNLYTYGLNNPLKLIDTDGHDLIVAPELQNTVNQLRQQSTSFNQEMAAHEGAGSPDLKIGFGTSPPDANGQPTTGSTHPTIVGGPVNTCSPDCVTEDRPYEYKGAVVTIDNSVKNDQAQTEDVLKHETGHVNYDRTDPNQSTRDSLKTKETQGKTDHDKRPEETKANKFKDKVTEEEKQWRKANCHGWLHKSCTPAPTSFGGAGTGI